MTTIIVKAAMFWLSIIVCCTGAGASSWSAERPTYQTDLSGSQLTQLYNSQVHHAEYWNRPLGSSGSSGKKRLLFPDGTKHAGVVVDTDYNGGSRWLIHKGNSYGDSSDTVITRASHMSSAWTRNKCGIVVSGHTVDDFMKKAYVDSSYNLLFINCQTAAKRMWDLVWETNC